jgi:hypothetical protein
MLQIGAATETEMKEKKARVEDALTRDPGAVEEGIVRGGRVAYLRALVGRRPSVWVVATLDVFEDGHLSFASCCPLTFETRPL